MKTKAIILFTIITHGSILKADDYKFTAPDFCDPNSMAGFRAQEEMGEAQPTLEAVQYNSLSAEDLTQNTINQTDSNGKTVLMWAAMCSGTDILKMILANQYVDVNAKDDQGKTAYLYAAMYGNLTALDQLITYIPGKNAKPGKKVDVKAVDNDGKNAFFLAAQNNLPKIVLQKISDGGTPLTQADKEGVTPLMAAIRAGSNDAFTFLLPTVSPSDTKQINVLLAWSARFGNVNAMKIFVEKYKADLAAQGEKDGMTPLMWAASQGQTEAIKTLLGYVKAQKKESVLDAQSKEGQTALLLAVKQAPVKALQEVVAQLVQAGVQVNKADNNKKTPLDVLVDRANGAESNDKENMKQVISDMLQAGAAVDEGVLNNTKGSLDSDQARQLQEQYSSLQQKQQALSQTINDLKTKIAGLNSQLKDSNDQIEKLNSQGSDLQDKLDKGVNPLRKLIVERLKAVGPALFDTIKKNNEQQALELIKQVEQVSEQSMNQMIFNRDKQPLHYQNENMTPLLLATKNNMLEVVKELVKFNVNLNQRGAGADGESFSPLEWAVHNGNMEMVKVLVGVGATINEGLIQGAHTLASSDGSKPYAQIADYLQNALKK